MESGDEQPPGRQRFRWITATAIECGHAAIRRASELGHREVEALDFLMGLTRRPDCLACQVLGADDLERIARLSAAPVPVADLDVHAQLYLSSTAHLASSRGFETMRAAGRRQLTTLDILIGMLSPGCGSLAEEVQGAGVDLAAIMSRAAQSEARSSEEP